MRPGRRREADTELDGELGVRQAMKGSTSLVARLHEAAPVHRRDWKAPMMTSCHRRRLQRPYMNAVKNPNSEIGQPKRYEINELLIMTISHAQSRGAARFRCN